jgi:DNA-binding MarR family transcriptional regulator
MPHYSDTPVPVKRAARTQRRQLLRLPDEMLVKQAERFPETFERQSIIALFALRSLAQRITDYTNDVLAPFGLNAAKFNYLMVLYVNPTDEMTLTELARFIHTSNATVTSMVRVLERDGLVVRRAHTVDGRSSVVRLTDEGVRVIEAAIPVHHGHWAAALEGLSIDERATLADLIVRAGTGFEKHFSENG